MQPDPEASTSLVSAALLGITTFTATNIDDIFILVAFFAGAALQTRHIVLGQYLGIAALTAAGILVSLVSLVLPTEYIGLLGLAPIGLGIKELLEQRRADSGGEDTPIRSGHAGGAITVAAVTIANGGDNIAVYAPVFAVLPGVAIAVVAAVFAVMTGLWCAAADWFVRHPTLGAPVRTYGSRFLPWVLLLLGLVVLWEAGTIELIRSS